MKVKNTTTQTLTETTMKTMSAPMQIQVGMKLRISGRIMKVQAIENGVATMLHSNGCAPARHSERFAKVEFLERCAKPSDWKPKLTLRSELTLNI
ncbi:hypothetical protein N9955_00655 [bacterium]|nr:hypothetical protein [bacterium]